MDKYIYLNKVNSPADLRKMDFRELELLCAEIRDFLIEKVSQTGGHLSSNLGVIELTVALHRQFNSPTDMFVFDVGHQCYTHKLLTGRKNQFDTLRQAGGISGFPYPGESEHDIVRAGHASAALSAGIGLARAKKLKNEPGFVIVIVGDGAFTGGMTYEGINNLGELDNLLIVLNDNKMSISKNVGALAQYLKSLRTSPGYYKAKSDVKTALDKTPFIGGGVKRSIQSVKDALRKTLYHTTFFEEMGLRYIGPVDGHDVSSLCSAFTASIHSDRPLLLHIETKKGKGFKPAERNPGAFHGVPVFNAQHIPDPDFSPSDSFSTVFGRELARLGGENERICAITAAMKYGTGLQFFKKAHLARFFDVGMAEEHAVTFAGGLAANGMLPVVAIYSTFLQRSYDQLIHDVALGNMDVLFAVDRAGLVPDDGETHQGIYDTAFFSQQRNLPIVAPANYAELRFWLKKLLGEYSGPRVIRYPRGTEPQSLASKGCTGQMYDKIVENPSATCAIVSFGTEIEEAVQAEQLLRQAGKVADVYQMVMINPIPPAFVQQISRYDVILFAEEGIARGGIGEHLAVELLRSGYKGRFIHRAIEDIAIDHARLPVLRHEAGLDSKSLADAMLEGLA